VATLPAASSRAVTLCEPGRVLALGGLTSGDVTTARIVAVPTAGGAARVVGALRSPVHDASGAVLGGRAVVFGGGAASELATVQAWRHGTSRIVGSLPSPRSDSAAVLVGSTAYVVGGFDGSRMARDVLATSDGRHFRRIARLPVGVRYPAVAAVGSDIWVVGGLVSTITSAGPYTDAVQEVDVASGRARVAGRLPAPLAHAMAFALRGSVFVAGGRTARGPVATIRRLLPDGTAVRAGTLPTPESDAGVCAGAGNAWLVGGETSSPVAPLSAVVRVQPG
jgi:N-acetylneuraminic acid mutarotase